MNKVFLIGRLTADPELRYTQSQTPVASFTVAVDRRFSGKDDAKKVVDFFPCVAWRSTAEFVSRYFTKGQKIVIEGSIQNRDWEDKEGNKRRTTEVVCDNVEFGESKKEGGASSGRGGYDYSQHPAQPACPPAQQQFEELPDDDEELPF